MAKTVVHFHGDMRPPLKVLPSGRRVVDTGKVLIGICAKPRVTVAGRDAEAIQAALLAPSCLSNKASHRLARAVRRIVAWLMGERA